ncbi:UNVERIFIED_CONTAM: hypothetical protein ABIE34_001765 [Jeotgalibacillus campisalis]
MSKTVVFRGPGLGGGDPNSSACSVAKTPAERTCRFLRRTLPESVSPPAGRSPGATRPKNQRTKALEPPFSRLPRSIDSAGRVIRRLFLALVERELNDLERLCLAAEVNLDDGARL